ncbi:MAG: T9SS type A sorting domain-containing protein [Crocinitomicaceae bacterium]|nr:T9SS type A sorting domain-containing protein [Crocinitomicaceae bacterium]
MKKIFIILSIILSSFTSNATIHVVYVWHGYNQFIDAVNFSEDITIQLGDTVQWLPFDDPGLMVHTITSTNIPSGAASFDHIWQVPDTFFQYVPQVAGLYEYECTPHEHLGMIGSIDVIEGVSGITDVASKESEMLIYPNPTTDVIHFKKSSFVYPYKIFSSKGELVLSGTTNDIVNVSTFLNGTYHIQILGDKPRIMKFIKQ